MFYTSDKPAPLTKGDIAFLRDATKVCFDHNAPSHNPSGMGQIRVTVAVKHRDRTVELEERLVVGTVIQSYARHEDDATYDVDYIRDDLSCFEMLHSPQFDMVWPTIVQMMKPGDLLTLHWRRGNTSPLMDEIGIVQDQLFLILERSRGEGKEPRKLAFEVRSSVSKPNSARMIRTKAEMYR